jgi:protocatechuate 3,4-dioxygenase alpha subunit
MTSRPVTPSQTVGPFFHDCLLRDGARCDTIVGNAGGAQIRVEGRVLDGDGVGVPDAVIEVWHSAGFARVGTEEGGGFAFTTSRPERAPYDGTTLQAPHLSVAVFARGLMNHLFTRIYFEDEPTTAADPILRYVPEARRATLVAKADPDGSLTLRYRFDVVLQGTGETVFFDFKAPAR